MIALNDNILDTIRQRRSTGESLGKLAREAGVSWQWLWTMLYPSAPAGEQPVLQCNAAAGSLTEKYRPTSLEAIWGQGQVVKVLRKFAADPHPAAFIFEGETGTGKTSASLALAQALGCDLGQKEFGGVRTISSGEQSPEAVKETYRAMWNIPWQGSGWKVVIVNEADRMSGPAETVWLDRLESLPQRTVVIFTTNYAAKLSQRFLDRCIRLSFASKAEDLRSAAFHLAVRIWKAETGKKPGARKLQEIIKATERDGQISFRRLIQSLTVELG